MYPIPAEQNLSLTDIANHWSREITPRVEPREVLDGLIKAWWRGELKAASPPSRADMLRALYKTYQDRIAFVAPGLDEPPSAKELPDEDVVVFRLWRVPLPNTEPKSWDDTNCADAFEAVAESWRCDRFEIVMPSVGWIELTAAEFARWVSKNDFRLATFWGSAEEKKEDANPVPNLGKKRAAEFAKNYIAVEKKEGRQPTQSGLEKEAHKANLRGGREHLRYEFNRMQRLAGVDVKPGRIPKLR
jgi:hypothetical protein